MPGKELGSQLKLLCPNFWNLSLRIFSCCNDIRNATRIIKMYSLVLRYFQSLKFADVVRDLQYINYRWNILFVCFVWKFSSNSREFFNHLETSLGPVKGCQFSPMLGTFGHWAVRVLKHATRPVTGGIRL